MNENEGLRLFLQVIVLVAILITLADINHFFGSDKDGVRQPLPHDYPLGGKGVKVLFWNF